MAVRLIECWRVLKPTGSVYVHCDDRANSFLRMLLDALFGSENRRNEILGTGAGGALTPKDGDGFRTTCSITRKAHHTLGTSSTSRSIPTMFGETTDTMIVTGEAHTENCLYTPRVSELETPGPLGRATNRGNTTGIGQLQPKGIGTISLWRTE